VIIILNWYYRPRIFELSHFRWTELPYSRDGKKISFLSVYLYIHHLTSTPRFAVFLFMVFKFSPKELTSSEPPMLLFCVVTPCRLVDRYQLFGKTYCLHLHGCPKDGDSVFFLNSVIYLKSTQGHNPQEHHFHLHRREDLKSHISILFSHLCLGLSNYLFPWGLPTIFCMYVLFTLIGEPWYLGQCSD
jgi:hypothetical protein